MSSGRFGAGISGARAGRDPLHVAVGGLGAIGLRVARALDRGIPGLVLESVSALDTARAAERVRGFEPPPPIKPLAELADNADVVVECAAPAVFREVAEPALRKGRTLVPLSVGQLLVNPELFDIAEQNGARILAPSGAMLGLDALRAASEGEIREVRLVTSKPPRSLAGAAYLDEKGIDVTALQAPLKVFDGNAMDAAAAFPANINVGAALTLAGAGPARTMIEIWADPGLERNTHRISVEADSASFEMSVQSVPTDENPATGKLTPLSVINALRTLAATVQVGS